MGEKAPQRSQRDGRLSVLPILKNERSDLLDFRAGDKWQIVHGWIRGRLEVLISLRGAGHQQTSELRKGK